MESKRACSGISQWLLFTVLSTGTLVVSLDATAQFEPPPNVLGQIDDPGPIFDSPQGPCPTNMAQVNDICVDVFEASVWSTPVPEFGVTEQFGIYGEDGQFVFYPCYADGHDCTNVYALSLWGVKPSQSITWFVAQQACANVGKRLLTNAEWELASTGTPNTPASCVIGKVETGLTGTGLDTEDPSDDCVSRWGIFDMAGNVWEWTADWIKIQDNPNIFDDYFAIIRGGDYFNRAPNIPSRLAAETRSVRPFSFGPSTIGFRCAQAARAVP